MIAPRPIEMVATASQRIDHTIERAPVRRTSRRSHSRPHTAKPQQWNRPHDRPILIMQHHSERAAP